MEEIVGFSGAGKYPEKACDIKRSGHRLGEYNTELIAVVLKGMAREVDGRNPERQL